MAFKRGDAKKKIDYKSRLEHKLYLARETPEPVFDLSECNLKNVPNNIFSLCKVFRKEALYLQDNQLSSLTSGGSLKDLILLKALDLSLNKFSKLPDDIHYLENLEVLNLSENQLQELPESIGELKNLLRLNVSHNKLKRLPNSIGNCTNLQILNLLSNASLTKLPVSLCRAQHMNQLLIDSNIIYPPRDVCDRGIFAILEFLAKESGEVVMAPISNNTAEPNLPRTSEFSTLQEKIKLLEKLKDEKQRERLALERQLREETQKEVEMHQALKDTKSKLVEDLRTQQQSLDSELAKIQQKKDYERALLIDQLNDAEERANETVSKLLDCNQSFREKISALSEQERKMEEQLLLNIYSNTRNLEKKIVLESMNDLMREEVEKIEKASQIRHVKVAEMLASEDSLWSSKLVSLVEKSSNDRNKLVETINRNEDLQKTAVATLLERSDTRSWELAKQVSMVQSQLAELTKLELAKKRLEADNQIAELSNNRVALTNLLMDLFAQQYERRNQLIETLRKMEGVRRSDEDSETFWMEQYQKLLDSKSHQLVEALKNIDSRLVNEFFLNGVFHYLPLLTELMTSVENLQNINVDVLSQIGVQSEEDQASILKAIKQFLKTEEPKSSAASAPEEITPSAPFLTPSTSFSNDNDRQITFAVAEDCVVCLDVKAEVIFTPCGHICCCSECSVSIALCPLCRVTVSQILLATTQV